VKLVFSDGDLNPFLSLRVQMERAIRAQCSENVILQVHDAVYAPVKRATEQLNNAVEAALAEALGFNPSASARARQRTSITSLRALLNEGAKERALQDGLIASGLLAVTCRVIQEVTMSVTDNHCGMRMDLVLAPAFAESTQIVELKRGSHLLIARRGKPTERLSKQFTMAIEQLQGYGQRLESDAVAVARIEERHGIQIHKPELRLIAGRRLSDANEYHLLSAAESEESASSLQLQVYTWDGFLAELERIVD
jgi:Domain of unknown function (DUF4263)